MSPSFRARRPPPWWPASEPWPPAHRGHGWGRRRSHFVRRVGCLFAILLFFSVVGAASLLSLVLAGSGAIGGTARFSLLGLVAALAVVILLAAFIGAMRRIGFPLGDIVEAADRVANGDLSTRVVERGPPPLRSVARAFNSMAGRLEAQNQLRRQLMADIAHELRTPLTVIQGRVEGLLDGVYPRDDERLSEILEDTRLLSRLIEDLRTLANAEGGTLALQKEPTDLVVLMQDAVHSFSTEADRAHVTMRVEGPANLPLIDVDPLRIREVLTNLLSNALGHSRAGGTVSVAAEALGDHISIKVRDTGLGISPEDLPRIFDRFYKGPTSRGSGLGLTIARDLVAAHDGDIKAESRLGEGTTMTFTLPLPKGE